MAENIASDGNREKEYGFALFHYWKPWKPDCVRLEMKTGPLGDLLAKRAAFQCEKRTFYTFLNPIFKISYQILLAFSPFEVYSTIFSGIYPIFWVECFWCFLGDKNWGQYHDAFVGKAAKEFSCSISST